MRKQDSSRRGRSQFVQSDMAGEVPWTPAWPPKAGAGPARSERRCLAEPANRSSLARDRAKAQRVGLPWARRRPTIAPRVRPRRTEGIRPMVGDARNEEVGGATNVEPGAGLDQSATSPSPAAVAFVTTEHFTLQGARASTIAESTGRATMFIGAVSGGLVALGLVATASRVGNAFYAFGLVVLPTLAFIGLVTFERVLQSGIEDRGDARRRRSGGPRRAIHADAIPAFRLEAGRRRAAHSRPER